MIRVGVIGYGYWGPNLVRNFADLADASVTAVCDRRPERLAQAQRRYPGIRTTGDPMELIADPSVDAVVIATPVGLHFELANAALRAGKHVLVEKPITSTSDEARRLIDEAARRRLVLMVDHTFIYTGAVQKMRELVVGGELGDINYYDSVRINLGLFQPDVDVLWDLAVHDLSIMDFVLPQQPVAVSAPDQCHKHRAADGHRDRHSQQHQHREAEEKSGGHMSAPLTRDAGGIAQPVRVRLHQPSRASMLLRTSGTPLSALRRSSRKCSPTNAAERNSGTLIQ